MFAKTRKDKVPQYTGRNRSRALDTQDLRGLFGDAVQTYTPNAISDSPLISGKLSSDCLREGFFLHCTHILHMQDMISRFPGLEPSVKILLKLEGNAVVKIGKLNIDLDAGQAEQAVAKGALVVLREEEDFERSCRAGTQERMVVITLTPVWFKAAGLNFDDFQPHLALHDWQPSMRAIHIAEQLLQPVNSQTSTRNLYQESRALELIAEALGSLQPMPAKRVLQPLRLSEYQRIAKLKQLLDSGHADQLSLTEIAQSIGYNASSLQRQFRQIENMSIFDYLRESRLKRAALAIEKKGHSIAYAAAIAGYSSAANFSTAFRKYFGISPKALKSR